MRFLTVLAAVVVLAAAGCSAGGEVSAGTAVAATAAAATSTAVTTTTPGRATITTTAVETATGLPTTTAVAPPPPVTATGGLVSSIPRPNSAQAQELYVGLLNIEPGFSEKKRDTLISRSRDVCSQILGRASGDAVVAGVVARFTTPSIEAITTQQATEVADLIRGGGWCA